MSSPASWMPGWLPADPVGTECADGPQPGTEALRAGMIDIYGGVDLGIYNCREVRGGGALSVHAEGRAWDLGVIKGDPGFGDFALNVLANHAHLLGIQRVIWNRRLYDAASPLGRPYSSVDPHTTHLHIEQTWAAAWLLTTEAVRRALYGLPEPREGHVLLLRRSADDADTMRWMYVDGRRYRLQGWESGVQPLIDAGVATVALADHQLQSIPEV